MREWVVLEALSRESRTSCPWELLYADDPVLIAETLDLLMVKLKLWKDNTENKGLRVNMGTTKVMICGKGLGTTKPSGKYPCSVCRKRVGRNSIFCTSCDAWVHEKCSEIKGRLVYIPDFKCHRWISPNGGCEVSTIAKIRSAWGKFRELLPLLTYQAIPLKSRGKVYNSCIRSVMLYGSECWALTTADVLRLQRNERAMVRWICKVKIRDKISSDSLLNKLCLKNPDITLWIKCLRWFGHVCRSNSWIKKYTQHEVAGKRERSRPRKTWQQCVNCDLKSLKLSKDLTSNRNAWREALRMAISPTRKKCGTWAQSG